MEVWESCLWNRICDKKDLIKNKKAMKNFKAIALPYKKAFRRKLSFVLKTGFVDCLNKRVIKYWCQFHQYFMSSFLYKSVFWGFYMRTVNLWIFLALKISKKGSHKMFVKRNAGVNFINVKCANYKYESAFWQLFLCWWNCHLVFFEAFLYLHFVFVIFWQRETVTKSCLKNLVKLSTGINFINILQTAFLYPSVQKGIILKIRTMHLISNTSLCLSLSQSVTSVLLNMDNMYIISIYMCVCLCVCVIVMQTKLGLVSFIYTSET